MDEEKPSGLAMCVKKGRNGSAVCCRGEGPADFAQEACVRGWGFSLVPNQLEEKQATGLLDLD